MNHPLTPPAGATSAASPAAVVAPPAPAATKSSGVWQRHPLDGDLGVHSVAWDDLNQRQFNNHPLLDSRFWGSLLRHFGHPGIELWVYCQDAQASAMCILERAGWGRWRSFKPSQAPLGPVMISDAGMVDVLLRALGPRAFQVDLLCIDPDLCAFALPPLRRASQTLHLRTMDIQTSDGFDAYWATRPAGLRQNLRRYERLAASAGIQLDFRVIDQPGEMAAAVTHYAKLESGGWKAAQGTALTLGGSQSLVYVELLQTYGLTDQAVVHELWHGEQLAASRLMLHGGGIQVMLKTSYDEALSKYAVGWRLLACGLQKIFGDTGTGKIDFYTDAHDGQLPWGTGFRWIRHLTFYQSGLTATLWHGLQIARQALLAPARRSSLADDGLEITQQDLSKPWPKDLTALFEECAKESLEISQSWYENLHRRVFSQHPGVALWVLRKDGKAVAALPLIVEEARLGQQLSVLGNYYTAFFSPTVAASLKPAALAVLVRHLICQYRHLGQLSFDPMDPESDGFHRLAQALELSGLVCFKYFRFGNWYLPQQTGYAQYLKGRSANLRSTIKRMHKRTNDEGGHIEIITAPGDVARGMAAYWHVYRSSWKQDEPFPEFIDGLAEWSAAQGQLRLGLVWLNDTAIAAQIWLVAHGKCEIFKVAYDEAHKALSPGTVLTAALLERVLDHDGVKEVDFLIGDDQYKRNWMSHRRERWGLVAYDPRRAGGGIGILKELLGRAVRHFRPVRRLTAGP